MSTQAAPQPVWAFEVITAHTSKMVDAAILMRGWKTNKAPFWQAEVGDIGFVSHESKDRDGFAAITRVQRTENGLVELRGVGYIPRKFLKVGEQKKDRPTTVGDVPDFKSPSVVPEQASKFSVFMKTLIRTWGEEKATLVGLGCSQGHIDWAIKKDSLYDAIEHGMKRAKTFHLFRDGCPTWDTLRTLKPVVSQRNKDDKFKRNPGIYALLYRLRFANRPPKLKWYVGNSVDIEYRLRQHEEIITSTDPPTYSLDHYTAAQEVYRSKDGDYCCVALAVWDPRTIEDFSARILFSSEQFFQCALSSLSSRLLESPLSVGDYVARGQDYAVGSVFRQLTQKVAGTVGWPLSTGVSGLNFSMALAEASRGEFISFTKVVLMDSDNKPKMDVFVRQAKVYKQGGEKVAHNRVNLLPQQVVQVGQKRTTVRSPFSLHIPDGWGIPAGTPVNIIVEVVPEGKLHHTPWLIIPSHAQFSNFAELKRLGIRVEWYVNGIWKSGYIQQEGMFVSIRSKVLYKGFPESKYILQAYARAMELFSALYRVQYQPAAPRWFPPIANVNLTEVAYSHLKQQLQISKPEPIQLPTPWLVHPTHNHKALVDRFGRNLITGKKPDNVFSGHLDQPRASMRKACDVCFLTLDGDKVIARDRNIELRTSAFTGKSERYPCIPELVDGEWSCKFCQLLRRPCTWTHEDHVSRNGWQDLLLQSCSKGCLHIKGPSLLSTELTSSKYKDTHPELAVVEEAFDDDDD
ncbi:hypothetical protein IFR04_003784 [Cadophora malorum]|uniref:GIY-YIG domain-containing protein n=1 Tax=Cadophora malorum TaxID=108018 RepID=A0A8H7WE70_9HELO|nr:hypothetical protein IFR04_003784 [Cadophora malorum]